jgi:protein-disulfide isomerase
MASRSEDSQADPGTANRRTALLRLGLLLALAAVVVIVAIVLSSSGDSKSSSASRSTGGGDDAAQVAALFKGVPQSGVTLGDPKSKVTLLEFADLQCPFCAEYTKTAFPQLVQQYVQPGKVKVVFRNLTFIGPDSVKAARAAAAAGQQNKLWNFVDTFYANQGEENSGYVTDQFIAQVAAAAGVDAGALAQAQGSPDVAKQIGEAQQMAQQFKVNSTPSFLIQTGNGTPRPLGNKSADFGEISKKLDAALR